MEAVMCPPFLHQLVRARHALRGTPCEPLLLGKADGVVHSVGLTDLDALVVEGAPLAEPVGVELDEVVRGFPVHDPVLEVLADSSRMDDAVSCGWGGEKGVRW